MIKHGERERERERESVCVYIYIVLNMCKFCVSVIEELLGLFLLYGDFWKMKIWLVFET
jgi:hypothetical protein